LANGGEIRTYCGDFEDVAELIRRVWIEAYGGKMWFPLWDAAFLRREFGTEGGALCLAVSQECRLSGSFLATPHILRMGSSTVPITLSSWCTVDPRYGRFDTAVKLLEAMRQRHENLGLAFSLGVVSGDPASRAYRFWTQYAKTYPENLRFLFSFGLWTKALRPEVFAQAAVSGSERWAARLMGPLCRWTMHGSEPGIRSYRPADLDACSRLLERTSGKCQWALLWSRERLARQLDGAGSHTVVVDQGGHIRALVNYNCLSIHGRGELRAALIDLWADDGLTLLQRARLLGHVCHDIRGRDIHVVAALRCAMMPSAAFAANLFLPSCAGHVVALFPGQMQISPPKTWSLVMR
jgi:hypothetical protein